jgi:hypothetical protein
MSSQFAERIHTETQSWSTPQGGSLPKLTNKKAHTKIDVNYTYKKEALL